MGRFYKTALPRFERGITHKTPWELASRVIQKKEGEINNMFQSAEVIEGSTANMNYLDFEKDKAAEIQDKYAQRIDEITQQIQEDPMNAAKYQPALKSLQRDLQRNRMKGEWGNIESRYAAVQNWQKENADLKKAEPGNYALAQATFMDRLKKGVAKNPEASWGGYDLVAKPTLKEKETRERFENIKANIMENTGPNGMYNYKGESITEDRVAIIAMNELMSQPNFQRYIEQQRDLLGEERFKQMGFDQPIFTEGKNGQMSINANNPFAREVHNAASTYGYQELSKETNDYGLEDYKQKNRIRLLQNKHALEKPKPIFPKTFVTETKNIFAEDQLKELAYAAYFPYKQSIRDGNSKEFISELGAEKTTKLKKYIGMADKALEKTPGMTEQMLNDYAMYHTPEEEQYNYKKGYKREPGTGINIATIVRERKQEYIDAERRYNENKKTFDEFNKKLEQENTQTYSTLPIDETESEVGKILGDEVNILLSGEAMNVYNPSYAPWEFAGLGNTQPMELDGDLGVEWFSKIRAQEGLTPLEMFAPGSVRRIERGDKIYYTGTILPKLVTNYGLEPTETGGQFDGRVTIEAPRNNSQVLEFFNSNFKNNPDLEHAFKMTDNIYHNTFELTDFNINQLEYDKNKKTYTTPTFSLERFPGIGEIEYDQEDGYQLYITSENEVTNDNGYVTKEKQKVLLDRILVPVYNDRGEIIGKREEKLTNSREDMFKGLLFLNKNPRTKVLPDN